MKYIVYKTTCLVNNKIYIGVHGTEDPGKFDGYLGCGVYKNSKILKPYTAFKYAVKKYGFENFVRETLYVFDDMDQAYEKENKIVNLEFLQREDTYNMALGGTGKKYINYDKRIYKSNNNDYDRPIYQYDMQGNYIATWENNLQAIKHYNCNDRRFYMAIINKYSAFNSYWSYEKVDHLDISEYRRVKHEQTMCYTMDGTFVKAFNKVSDIIDEFGFTRDSINWSCQHRHPLKGYFFVSDGSDINEVIGLWNKISNLQDSNVSRYDIETGKLIKTYAGLKTAAREVHHQPLTIKKAIENKTGEWAYGCEPYYNPNNTVPQPIKIDQYDLDGNFIKTWDSLEECRKNFKKVKEILRGGRNHEHGFTFKLHETS